MSAILIPRSRKASNVPRSQIRLVFAATKETILQNALRDSGALSNRLSQTVLLLMRLAGIL